MNLDLLDELTFKREQQMKNDAAIAKAACEEQIIEEETQPVYDLTFDISTQDSSDLTQMPQSEPVEESTLAKRVPLKNRERADTCYHRLPYQGRMHVIE